MPRMIFLGSNGDVEISTNDDNIIVSVGEVKTELTADEAVYLYRRIMDQVIELKDKKRKKLSRWKQLLTV